MGKLNRQMNASVFLVKRTGDIENRKNTTRTQRFPDHTATSQFYVFISFLVEYIAFFCLVILLRDCIQISLLIISEFKQIKNI